MVEALERAVKQEHPDKEALGLLVSAAAKVSYHQPRDLTRASWAVAKLAKGRTINGVDEFYHAVSLAEIAGGPDEPRRVATLLWALATCHQGERLEDFASSLSRRAMAASKVFNARDCAQTAWAVAKLSLSCSRKRRRDYHESLDAVAERALEVAGDLRPCETSHLVWACAKVGRRRDVIVTLVATLDTTALSSRQVATVAWALAKTDTATPAVLNRLAARAWHARKPAELANLAWSFATARHVASPPSKRTVFRAVAHNALVGNRLDQFTSRELANTAWAFAKCGDSNAALFSALAHACADRIAEFAPQEIANCAWAFAKANVSSATRYFNEIEQVLPLPKYASQGLSMTAWALATAGHPAKPRFWEKLALVASARVSSGAFNGQDIATTLWALAKAGERSSTLVVAVAARTNMDDLNAQELSMTAWALAKAWAPFDITTDVQRCLDAIARSAGAKISFFNSQELANTCWAFARCHKLAPPFSSLLSDAAISIMHTFEAQHLANTAWAFAKAGIADARLFAAIAHQARYTHFAELSRIQLRQAALFLKHKAPDFACPALIDARDENDNYNAALAAPEHQSALYTPASSVKLCPHFSSTLEENFNEGGVISTGIADSLGEAELSSSQEDSRR